MVTTAMAQQEAKQLQIDRAEALIAMARLRLQPPEREQVIETLQGALESLRRSEGSARGVAASQIVQAEAKAIQAEADREEKRRPYEADPLFMYLWRRRYGTRDYKASNFVRYFDRKVAHLIGFETARINYTMLMELPDRMREHADRLKAAGPETRDDALQRLVELQRSPAVAALMRPETRETPDEAAIRRRVEAIDSALAGAHQPVVAKE
jgi:hypothetical protein